MSFLNTFRFYKNKKILVTGHTGFKGAWLSFWLNQLSAKVCGYALEEASPTHTALGIKDLLQSECFADIRDFNKLNKFFIETEPDIVFHLAAQALVSKSFEHPLETLQTNFMGTAHVLEVLRHARKPIACVIVTSDKCYAPSVGGGLKNNVGACTENSILGGNDVYSASKAACEILVSAYQKSFFRVEQLENHALTESKRLPLIATARAGNVIGGGDYALNRIIPDCVRAIVSRTSLSLRNPHGVRPWQFVLEPLLGYLELGYRLSCSANPAEYCQAWNFGSTEECSVAQLVDQFLNLWDTCGESTYSEHPNINLQTKILEQNDFEENPVLRLSSEKACQKLGWKTILPLAESLKMTAEWYKAYEASDKRPGCMQAFTIEQIESYKRMLRM